MNLWPSRSATWIVTSALVLTLKRLTISSRSSEYPEVIENPLARTEPASCSHEAPPQGGDSERFGPYEPRLSGYRRGVALLECRDQRRFNRSISNAYTLKKTPGVESNYVR